VRSLIGRDDVAPCLRYDFVVVFELSPQLYGLGRVEAAKPGHEAPAAADIVTARAVLAHPPRGGGPYPPPHARRGRQPRERRALEIDVELDGAVLRLHVPAPAARFADPGVRRPRLPLLLPQHAIAEGKRLLGAGRAVRDPVRDDVVVGLVGDRDL